MLRSTTPVILHTTKYYSSTTPYYKVLFRTTPYYSSTTPYYKVLIRTTKYYSSTTPYYKVLFQYYSVLQSSTLYYKVLLQYYSILQSTTPTETTSERRPSNTTPYYKVRRQYYKSFQNEHFVRGFRNFSSNKLPKRAFRARLPQLFKQQASKTSISCEASATFQATSFQNEHFVRGFRNFSMKKLPKRCACHAKRENDLSS